MGQAEGIVLGNVRAQINNLDVVVSKQLGKGVWGPEELRAWLLGKNEILVEENLALSDYEQTFAFRGSRVLMRYKF